MSRSMIMRNDNESMFAANAVESLTRCVNAPTLLLILGEHVVLQPAQAVRHTTSKAVEAERALATLRSAVAEAEASFNVHARRLVRSVVLPTGVAAREVNRACFGDMTMNQLLRARRDLKLLRFTLYIQNLSARQDVSYDAAELIALRQALEALRAAHAPLVAAEARVASAHADRRAAITTFDADYARFANAAKALWGIDAIREWLPVFVRAELGRGPVEPVEVAPSAAPSTLTAVH